jgi:anti-sigma regulatory factor (Ser/Thr protein kinase)
MSGHELLFSRIAFTAAPGAVRRARLWIAGQLARTDPADLVDTAVLLVSELVTNAVRASAVADLASGRADPCRIELAVARTSDTVRIEVSDSACGSLPVPSAAADDDESGRGLQVITALSKRWGCQPAHHGKVVWCELAAVGLGRAAGQAAAIGQPLAAAGCVDLSRPGSVAVRHMSPVAVCADIASPNGT